MTEIGAYAMSNQHEHSNKTVVSVEGMKKLEEKLLYLSTIRRAEVAEQIAVARGFGDLSENAEYHAAKEEQEKLENRVLWLDYQLSKAKIVDAEDVDTSSVSLGTTVTLKDLDLKKTFVYTLVGTEEADIKENRISAASPVGMAITGKKVNDEVMVRTPRGIRHLKIMKIRLK